MTRATITVDLTEHQPNCPLGLLLAPLITNSTRSPTTTTTSPLQSHHTILIGWTRPYNKLGLVQKSGQVRIGDRLAEINDVSVRQWNYEKIIRVLRCFDDGVKIRSLGFEVLKDESGIGYEDRNFRVAGARRRLYCLNTFVRSYKSEQDENERGEIDRDDHLGDDDDQRKSSTVVKFEIKCNLLIRQHQGNDEELNWSCWKRYSEIEALHEKLMKEYEWQFKSMNAGKGARFPSKHAVGFALYGKENDAILGKRQKEIEVYWETLQSCQDLFDFGDPQSHKYARDMAEFLDVERYLHSEGTGSITSQGYGHLVRGNGRNSLDLDVSAISMHSLSETAVVTSAGLKLDDPAGTLGEILVKSNVSSTTTTSAKLLRTSRSIGSTATNKSVRKRRGPPAKPAFQRRLLDDL